MKIKFLTASWAILKKSFYAYPRHSLIAVAAVVMAGTLESVGLLTLLPVIGIAMKQHGITGPHGDIPEYQALITHILTGLNLNPSLPALLTLMSCMIIMKALLLLLAKSHIGSATAHISADLRLRLLRALLSASWPYFLSHQAGRFGNALSTEAARASTCFMAGWFMIAALIQAVVLLSVAFSLSSQIFFAAFFAGAILSMCLSWSIRRARRAGTQETQLMNQLVGRLTDYLQGIKPLKAMELQNFLLPYLERDTKDLRSAQSQQSFAFAIQAALPEPLLLAFLALGMYWALIFTKVGLPVLFILAVFFNRIMGRASEAQKCYQMMVSNESAFQSIKDAIDGASLSGQKESNGSATEPVLSSAIRFHDVSFSYNEKSVIKKSNICISARKLTVLFGPSGSGKTTIADLISGLLVPQSGAISIDGISYDQIDKTALRRSIGYVPQEVFLFHDTLANNISLRDPGISDKQIWDALDRAEAASFVRKLEKGIHTDLGERGGRLSGGQRQRIMVARALVRMPQILVLDEATAALDPASERQLCATVKALAKDITVIAISHQPALKEMADDVIDMSPAAMMLDIPGIQSDEA